ncbi:MAG: cysteine sulfinate desulfinase [Gammaproteobacteria bacterium RIFCSPHIGHO2_12_FULL_38_11]|nr:MAG: cysteine sulfinate desulfinase [Gammaproteobacteria bacterium RIFCSPHIGHO2_12_FULL_38_11]
MMRDDFPIFKHNPDLIYLDSASTSQKPQSAIDAEMQFYEKDYANVHRGIYKLSESATSAYECVREKVMQFINAKCAHEIIFTKGTTEAINLIAHSFGLENIKAGDEIIISAMEHHSNIVPWQQVCEKVGAKLIIIPLLNSSDFDLDFYFKALTDKVKLVAVIHVSNVLGTINPVKKIIQAAREKNIPVLLDGAQAIGHMPVDVQDLDCDFYVFSAHKMYGPTGVGVLYGKEKYLDTMTPYQTGGNMIRQVTFEKTEFNVLPNKLEPGTPNIAGVIGFGAAIDYILGVSSANGSETISEPRALAREKAIFLTISEPRALAREKAIFLSDRESLTHDKFYLIQKHEQQLLNYTTEQLQKIDGLTIYGTSKNKLGVISFTMNCAHPHDIATILDQSHVAVRAGHHCAMPLIDYLNVSALVRISFGVYNECSDIDALIMALKNVRKIFHV